MSGSASPDPAQLLCLPPPQAHEDSQESLTSLPRRDTMGSFLPDSSSYELLAVIGACARENASAWAPSL